MSNLSPTPNKADVLQAVKASLPADSEGKGNDPSCCQDNAFIQSEQNDLGKAQISLLIEEITDLKHYRDLRDKYALAVFIFMCSWVFLVFLILGFKGFSLCGFALSDIVLTTLVGGTTVSVIGLVGFMMQGLFGSNKRDRKH